MLTSASATTVTSITSTLAMGVTAASVLLSFVFVALLISKEVSITHETIDVRVADALNAALIPFALAFAAIFVLRLV